MCRPAASPSARPSRHSSGGRPERRGRGRSDRAAAISGPCGSSRAAQARSTLSLPEPDLVRAPRGYPADHELIEDLKRIPADAFVAVDTSSLQVDPDSAAVD